VRRPKTDGPPLSATTFGLKKRPSGTLSSLPMPTPTPNKKILDRKADLKSPNPALNRKTKFTKKLTDKTSKFSASTTATIASVESTPNGKDVKVKKTYRKRKGSEKVPERRLSGGKKVSRRKSTATVNSDTDGDSHDAGVEDEDEVPVVLKRFLRH
jgi:hypothetical protein